MKKPILIAAMVALGALMLVAAGCGGKKKADATTVEQTQAADTTAATTEATTTEETDTDSTSTESSGDSTGDCQEFSKAISDVGTEFSQALSGTGNTDISKAAGAFDEMAQKAPAEIKDDFQTIDDAFQKMADALQGVDLSGGKTPDAATLQKLQKLGTEIDQAKLTAAQTNISQWVTANC